MNTGKKPVMLLTGVQGLVGWNLFCYLKTQYRVAMFPSPRKRGKGDWVAGVIRDYKRLPDLIGKIRPQTVIHAHAMCNLDVCEVEPEMTHQINVEATELLLKALDPSVHRLVHMSTEHVFSGAKGDYREEDTPDPISVYGRTRAIAERLVLNYPDMLLIRPGLAVGPSMQGDIGLHDFLRKRAKKEFKTSYFIDEVRSPIRSADLCAGVDLLIKKGCKGIFHLGGKKKMSRYSLSVALMKEWGFDLDLIQAKKTAEDSIPRIRDCSLNSSKAEAFGVKGTASF